MLLILTAGLAGIILSKVKAVQDLYDSFLIGKEIHNERYHDRKKAASINMERQISIPDGSLEKQRHVWEGT